MRHASGQISTRHPMHEAPIVVTKPNADGRPVSITIEPRRRKCGSNALRRSYPLRPRRGDRARHQELASHSASGA